MGETTCGHPAACIQDGRCGWCLEKEWLDSETRWANEYFVEAYRLEKRVDELEKQLGEARAALRPFAALGGEPYVFRHYSPETRLTNLLCEITVGQIMHAHAILEAATAPQLPHEVQEQKLGAVWGISEEGTATIDGIPVWMPGDDYPTEEEFHKLKSTQEEGEYPARDGVRDTSVGEV